MLHILYFGHLVDALGTASENFELAPAQNTVADLCAALSQRGAIWHSALTGNKSLKITVNKQFVDADSPLKDGDEVAFVAFMVG
ncbi:MAG TPA: MoaD/ThiS family protein [Sulfuriferula sp.]|nr:MoaD/ThiS family protein [Sulfuriferula sp.]